MKGLFRREPAPVRPAAARCWRPRSNQKESRLTEGSRGQQQGGTERRRHPRHAISLECRWERTSGKPSTSQVTVLGVGGCYVQARNVPPIGEPIKLTAPLKDGLLVLRGRVVYARDLIGFGVEFQGLDMPTRKRLATLLSSAAEVG